MPKESEEQKIEHCNELLEKNYSMDEILKLVGLENYEIFENWLYSQIEDEDC